MVPKAGLIVFEAEINNDIHVSVHHDTIYENDQQDATV
jgi:hypothetical protein